MKRSALVTSGRFWCWSVTHNDVMDALAGKVDTDLESPLMSLSRHNGAKAPATVPRAQEKAFMQHAVASLLHWLATPADGPVGDPAVEQLQRNALWLGFLMVPHNEQEKSTCEHQLGQWIHRLPAHVKEPGKGFAHSLADLDSVELDHWCAPGARGLDCQSKFISPLK